MSLSAWLHRHKIFLFVVIAIILTIAGVLYWAKDGLVTIVTGKGSAYLGRDMAIADMEIDWGMTSRVHIKDLRLKNIQSAEVPYMVEIKTLNFSIRPLSLFIGKLVMPDIKIEGAKFNLEKKADGTANWDLAPFSKAQVAKEVVVPDDRHDFPLIGDLSIENTKVSYSDEGKKTTLVLALDTVSGKGGDGRKDSLTVKGDGTLQNKEFSLRAIGGSLNSLRDNKEDYPLTLDLKMGKTLVHVEGAFKDPVRMTGIDTRLEIKGDNLADLFYLTGIPLPPSPVYSLEGQLKKNDEVWAYENFIGKVGGSDLHGNLTYDLSGERGFVKADLRSSLLDMKDLGGFIGAAPSNPKPPRDALLPDVQLNLDRLRSADMDVSIKAAKLNIPNVPVNALTARFDLRNGILKIDPLDMGIAKGKIDGSLSLNGQKDTPDVKMDLVLKKLSLKEFFRDSRFDDLTSGTFGGRIQLAGQGKSLADVLSVSDGRLTILMSGGKISLLIIEAAGMDVAQAAPLLLDKDSSTHIRCAVGDFKVKNGILTSEAFVFDTEDSNVLGNAIISLKDETIDAQIRAQPKDPSLFSARTPITVTGKLKSPSVGISPGEISGRGVAAVVLGTVLTPVAAIIPFIELGLGEDSDCRGLIEQAKSNSNKSANSKTLR